MYGKISCTGKVDFDLTLWTFMSRRLATVMATVVLPHPLGPVNITEGNTSLRLTDSILQSYKNMLTILWS